MPNRSHHLSTLMIRTMPKPMGVNGPDIDVPRDEMMRDLDTFFPAYRFRSNKGYGTLEHRRVLSVLGPTPLHRRTFAGVQPPLFREGN